MISGCVRLHQCWPLSCKFPPVWEQLRITSENGCNFYSCSISMKCKNPWKREGHSSLSFRRLYFDCQFMLSTEAKLHKLSQSKHVCIHICISMPDRLSVSAVLVKRWRWGSLQMSGHGKQSCEVMWWKCSSAPVRDTSEPHDADVFSPIPLLSPQCAIVRLTLTFHMRETAQRMCWVPWKLASK